MNKPFVVRADSSSIELCQWSNKMSRKTDCGSARADHEERNITEQATNHALAHHIIIELYTQSQRSLRSDVLVSYCCNALKAENQRVSAPVPRHTATSSTTAVAVHDVLLSNINTAVVQFMPPIDA